MNSIVVWRALIASVISICILYLSFSHFRHSPSTQHDTDQLPLQLWFEQAKSHYYSGAYNQAYGYFKNHEAEFLTLPEGCELMISVVAQLKKLASLERISRNCLAQNTAVPMAAEGIAMALSQLGQAQEAITLLKQTAQHHHHARIWAALSQLSLYENQVPDAQQYLAQAIKASEIWSVWLERLLNQTKLHNPTYLNQITQIIAAKPQVLVEQEQRFMELLYHHNLDTSAQIIATRITSTTPSTTP